MPAGYGPDQCRESAANTQDPSPAPETLDVDRETAVQRRILVYTKRVPYTDRNHRQHWRAGLQNGSAMLDTRPGSRQERAVK